MPSYFPEGDVPTPNDDVRKLLQKWNSLLYIANGNMPVHLPEGSEPKSSDDERRSLIKIVALLQ